MTAARSAPGLQRGLLRIAEPDDHVVAFQEYRALDQGRMFGQQGLRLGRVGEFFCLFNSRGLSGCFFRIGEETLELAAGAFVVGFCFAPFVRVQEVGPGFFRSGYGSVEIFFVFLIEPFFFTFTLQCEGRFLGLLSRATSG